MKKYYKIFFLLSLLFILPKANAQHGPTDKTIGGDEKHGLVKWLTFKEAFELNKKNPKPFIIDVYTDWCGWCKHMMKTTYSNPGIAQYINTNFYPVQFDAETHDTIEYLGQTYINESTKPRSPHQLAIKLLNGQLSYPSTLFVMNNLQYTMNTSGFLDNKQIEPILIFTVENIWRTTPYDDFKQRFDKAFYDSATVAEPSVLKPWEELNKPEKKKKKNLLVIYTDWCNGCKVQNKTTFTDPLIKDYLNQKFNLIAFNLETKDSLLFMNQYFKYTGKYGNFHDLGVEMGGGQITLPTIIVLDEDKKPIDKLPYYLNANTLNPVLHFYGDDAYKTEKWQEFQTKFKEAESKPKEQPVNTPKGTKKS